MVLPARLKTVKKSATSASIAKKNDAEDGKEKRKHRHFKPSVIAKRRQNYYANGKGSVGVVVRYPRLVRYIRKIRKEQNQRYEKLTGYSSESKKIVLYNSFPATTIGAIDAYANRIMEFAAEHAKARKNNKGSQKTGLKLKKQDLDFAVRWIRKLTE